MNPWKLLGAGALLGAFAVAGRAQEMRFSQSLTNSQCVESGIVKLSTDQLAVLDALVRRDARFLAAPDTTQPPPPGRFSLRLLPDERHGAGFGRLTGPELARLDALVAEFEAGRIPAVPAGEPEPGWKPIAPRAHLEIHGLLTFTYGAGRGGYQEMGGAMALSIDDPVHGLSLLLGYGTSRVKGPFLDTACTPGGYPPGALLQRPR